MVDSLSRGQAAGCDIKIYDWTGGSELLIGKL